VTRRRYRQG